MQITVETLIRAPREKVFARAMEVERWPESVKAINKIELLTPGPVRVGTRFRETRIMFGREASEEMTFSEITPPERIVLTAESHGMRYRTEHLFLDEGGNTRLRLTFGGKPVTLAARLLTPLAALMAGKIRALLESDLADVKRAAESG
jgi:uncharacterized protein YndB with AHSA1/START domain